MVATAQPEELALLQQDNELLRGEVAVLRQQIAWFKQKLFGPGQSETLDRAQQLIDLGGEVAATAPARPVETISYEREKGPRAPRPTASQTFAHLPVQETIVIVPDEVKQEPAAYEQIGEERTFEVDVVAPKLFKRDVAQRRRARRRRDPEAKRRDGQSPQFVRPKFRRKADRTQPPVIAPAPARPVVGGYASAGLLSWVVVSKYVDHLPLFRQEKMLGRWGAKIPRQTLGDWVGLAADLLEPVYRQMQRTILASGYVQVDETPVRCQDPDRPGSTVQGWMWVVDEPDGDVVFRWAMSRRHQELVTLLGDYRGLLQSDAYAAYPSYAATHEHVQWLGCWAHARRGFFEALNDSPKAAQVVLRLIGKLYHLESQWDQAGVGDQRAALRQKHFARPLYWLRRIATGLRTKHLPRSLLSKACGYLLAHWDALVAHTRHAHTRLDNNRIENSIRPCAIGKKNFLFIGHPDAGQRSAIIYSIVGSCQRHGKDPHAYIRDVLARLPAMSNQDDLTPLLPAYWQPPGAALILPADVALSVSSAAAIS